MVLIVDDNEDFVAFMKDSLSLYFSIQVAANGQEAWNVIPELKPDLIVSDLMMPVMDGNELCRRSKDGQAYGEYTFCVADCQTVGRE